MVTDINIKHLLISILMTICPLWWVFTMRDKMIRSAYLLIVFFLWLYCGAGISLLSDWEYGIKYCLYICVFSSTLYFSRFKFNLTSNEKNSLNSFIINNSRNIVIFFFFLSLVALVYPVNKLGNLIHPPQVDLFKEFERREAASSVTVSSQLVDFAILIVSPFFYWALSKFVRKPLQLLLLLAINVYLNYCRMEYIGRHVILSNLMMYVWLISLNMTSAKRKLLIVSSLLAVPILSWGFYLYSLARIGVDVGNDVSYSYAIEELFTQEINYPTNYEKYKDFFNPMLIFEYLVWVVLLPFPGFLKFGYGNFEINKIFTYHLTGFQLGDYGFSIALPGLVGESFFVFGPFFVLHAIFLGLVIKYVLTTLRGSPSFSVLFCHYAIQLSFIAARGGTISVYSNIFKIFLYFIIGLMIIRSKTKYKQSK